MASRPSKGAAPVVVTGTGIVSPIGNDAASVDAALFGGVSAVRAQSLDLPGIDLPPVPIAAADFDAAAEVAPSRVPLDRGSAMALFAARAAARESRLEAGGFDAERLGIFWGSGMAGAATFEATCRTVYADRRRMRPTSVVTTMPNAPVAELALLFGARGAALAYACACASSAVAIGEAMRAIRAGWIDIAIAGGSEAMLTPGVLASWQAMRVLAPLSAAALRDPRLVATSCRPFAADRAGFALGEAAAAFVLESETHAARRHVPGDVHLAGYATNCDGMHITQPDAAGQTRAMQAALADAGLAAGDVGYVNAHGTATTAGDAAEADSLVRVFGERGVPVSSTKAIHGHLLGAGGAVELFATLRALQRRRLPPTAHVDKADPAFSIDLVSGIARDAATLRAAMSNSFAFGGTNAVLVATRGA
jgi:3-oxoacyl-[acyl-carrier-protein] synthase II